MKYLITFVLFLSVWSCKTVDTTPSKPLYNVYCLLDPKDEKISLFLGKVYDLNQIIPTDSGKYITNAKVIIKTANQSIQLLLNPKTKKYEASNKGFLKYETEYNLNITTENNDVLTAKCKIPAKIENFTYKGELNENVYSISFFWKNVNTEESYFKIQASANSNNYFIPIKWENGNSLWRSSSKKSTIESPVGVIENIAKFNSLNLNVSINIMDSFLADYQSKNEKTLAQSGSVLEKFSQPTILPTNIQNGIGVFSSQLTEQLSIKIK